MTTDLMKNCLQQCFCRSNVKRKIKHLQNIMTSMLHNFQIKSFLLQFSFFFEGKIYIQLLNIDKSFAAASAFFKEIIGLISYERNIIFFVCQLFLRPNSPAPLTDDWKVTDNSSVNFHDMFFFIFCQIMAKNEEKHVKLIYG